MGSTREYHKDGSYTDRDGLGNSTTHGPDGSNRDSVTREYGIPILGDIFHIGPQIDVTRDPDGNVTDVKHSK